MSNPATNWQPDLGELRSVHAASAETVKETPVFSLGELSRRCGGRVVVKAENMQRTGSFKLRGSLAKLAGPGAAECPGVVAGSAGNHGQALAYAARARGIPCTVFMPRDAAISKVNAVTAFGAEVVLEGGAIDECLEAARRLAAEDGLLFVHPFDDLEVIAGQAGVGLELREQVPGPGEGHRPGRRRRPDQRHRRGARRDRRRRSRSSASRPPGAPPSAPRSKAASRRASPRASTIADGIAVKRPGELTLELVRRWVEEIVTVDDDAIAEAMVLARRVREARHRGRRGGRGRGAPHRGGRARELGDDGGRPLRRQRRRPRPRRGDQPPPDRDRPADPPLLEDQRPAGRPRRLPPDHRRAPAATSSTSPTSATASPCTSARPGSRSWSKAAARATAMT